MVGSKDAEVDKVYRPRVTGEGSVSEAIKTKRRISWSFKNRILQSTGYLYFPESSSTFQHSLGTHRYICNPSTVFVRRGLRWQLRQESF